MTPIDEAVVESRAGVRIHLRVMPRASRAEVAGVRDGRIVVRVTAPPVDNAANDAVVEMLSRRLGVARRAITVVGGATSRNKTVEIGGANRAAVIDALSRE
jgi:uncharacterized protein (TIGR00251 family)